MSESNLFPRSTPRKSKRQNAPPGDLPQDMRVEIAMLRQLMRKVLERVGEDDQLKELLQVLDVVGKTCMRLSVLLKTERSLDEGQDVAGALNGALAELIEDMKNGQGMFGE